MNLFRERIFEKELIEGLAELLAETTKRKIHSVLDETKLIEEIKELQMIYYKKLREK